MKNIEAMKKISKNIKLHEAKSKRLLLRRKIVSEINLFLEIGGSCGVIHER
jgi:hypothetical protein